MAWREALKKPVAKPTAPKPKFDTKDDDWETDINYENQTSEKSQRYGSSSVPGSGRVDHVDFKNLQEKAKTADSTTREAYQNKNPNRGYGGKYGKDQVMDKSAADYSYRGELAKHSSQTDCNKGFGGAYGVDERAKDKSAVGFDYKGEVEKHPSQTDFSKGFGGKYGTDPNAQDKSAVGFSHRETVPKHPSQTDFSKGFGGKYGVQQEEPSRLSTSTRSPEQSSSEKTPPPVGSSIGVGNIRARFENMKKEQEEEAAKRVAEERNKRTTHDQKSQQKQPSTSNGHEKIKQPEIPPTYNQPARAPSPSPICQPEIQLPSVTTPIIYENLDSRFETQRSEEKQVESNKFIGGVNVASLLRARKASSSSSKHDDDDDEWADNHQHQSYRSPSPIPAAQPEPPSNNEGIRCIARYSYEKTEDDELGFEENEIITNVQKMHDEWWYGKIGSRSGLFPANYAEELN
ncbi:unnamed protein product [Rotaria magnacalcarata]|nr:unnamed protein product [Rotaria magnacalcarata]CAF2041201.1 unnamed protein product [Rotaria magnacalcarata]CAF2054229.1 unnamed protein product [Rotaria magnacalcarata]CAF2081102.1 unnamed protein product [Rotaria magnacalcarata]